jgi:hypothetical protein
VVGAAMCIFAIAQFVRLNFLAKQGILCISFSAFLSPFIIHRHLSMQEIDDQPSE